MRPPIPARRGGRERALYDLNAIEMLPVYLPPKPEDEDDRYLLRGAVIALIGPARRALAATQPEPRAAAEPEPALDVEIRSTHPYGFRSGDWAVLTGVRWANGRPCYSVRFPDGATDSWVVHDPTDPYEFRGRRP